MTEETLKALRQADTNLRDALLMDEGERAKMPADLNERLMQRVAKEQKKSRRIVVWPWIAAACVAGIMMIWLTPPKTAETTADATVAENKTEVETPVVNKVEEPKADRTPEEVKEIKSVKKVRKAEKPLLVQEGTVVEPIPIATPAAHEATSDLAVAEPTKAEEKSVTLTERDIPITRPENYKYTPEELALMKKQANEAYLKWAQLELEIAKHQLEQTAQK
jgi:hypothetical protein